MYSGHQILNIKLTYIKRENIIFEFSITVELSVTRRKRYPTYVNNSFTIYT